MFFPIAEIKIQVWHPGRFSHRCWKHLRGWRLCHVGHSHQGRGHWNFWPTIIRGKFHGHGQHSQKPSFWNCCGSVKLKYWSNPLHQQAKSVDLHRLYKCVFMHMWICIYIYVCVYMMHHWWCPRIMITQDRSALVSTTPLASAWHWSCLEPKAGHMLDETGCSHEWGVVVKDNDSYSNQRYQGWLVQICSSNFNPLTYLLTPSS